MAALRRRRIAAAAAVLLAAQGAAACAGLNAAALDEPYAVRGSVIIVHPRWQGDDPYPTADRYCRARQAYAKPKTITNSSASFTCVPLG